MNLYNDIKARITFVGNKWNNFGSTLQVLGIFQRTIIVLAVFLMITIWPMGLFEVEHVSQGVEDGTRYSPALTESEIVRQEFSPNYETVKTIDVYIANDPNSVDTMDAVFRLYNRQGEVLKEYDFDLEDVEFPGFVSIPINMELVPTELYFYTIGGRDGELITLLCNDSNKTPENGAMFYKDILSGGSSILTRYNYLRDMGLKRILFGDILISLLGLGLIAGVQIVRRSVDEEKWKKTEKVFKVVLCSLLAACTLIILYAIIIRKLFAWDTLNIAVLASGILILAIYVGVSICRCPSDYTIPGNTVGFSQKIAAFVRALLWAAAVIFCCLHTNGMTNYHKGLYMRCLLTTIGLLVVCYSKKKEIFNVPNMVWTLLSIPIGKYYMSFHTDHIEHINTATRDAFVIWAIGLVIINLCYTFRKERLKALKNIYIPYTIFGFLFMLLCVIFGHGRQWTLVLLVVALLLGLKIIVFDNTRKVMEDICNGVLLAFAGTTCFCVCRRPYQYYLLHRYGGVYATVTSNAVYLCTPIAAAFAKITMENDLNKRQKWFGVLGVVISFMLFTASRTGLLALTGCIVFYVLYPYVNRTKGWLYRNIKSALSGFIIICISFICTFTVTRMLPAVVGNPYYFDYEKPAAFMTEETPWSGYEYGARYMTIERFFDILLDRTTINQSTISGENVEETDKTTPVAEPIVTNTSGVDNESDYTNGRLDIFREYISRINMQGHDVMGFDMSNGEYMPHAHNTYLQALYDFGIPIGVLFLIMCFWAFVRSCRIAYYGAKTAGIYTLPMYMVVAFGLASVSEWTYYLTIPLGFMFIIMLIVMCDKQLVTKFIDLK